MNDVAFFFCLTFLVGSLVVLLLCFFHLVWFGVSLVVVVGFVFNCFSNLVFKKLKDKLWNKTELKRLLKIPLSLDDR